MTTTPAAPPTSTVSAVLRHILEHPFDVAARGIWADALEEAGEEVRAEIVLSNEVAVFERLPFIWTFLEPQTILAPVLSQYLQRVGDMGADEWPEGSRIVFTGGLVSSLSLPLAAFWGPNGVRPEIVEVFRREPVVEVRLTDREPENRMAPRVFFWAHADNQGNSDDPERSLLPSDLFWLQHGDYIGDPDERLRWYRYPSAAAAHSALSRACVTLARTAAGLPPITWVEG